HGLGKSNSLKEAEDLARRHRTVLAVDLTGFGELQGCKKCGDFDDVSAKDESDAALAYLMGSSLVGMRANDILQCARWLAADRKTQTVELRAASWAVTPALHAAVCEPLFSAVTLTDRPMSWRDVVKNGDRHRFSDIVHGALRDYDLSDLERAIGN